MSDDFLRLANPVVLIAPTGTPPDQMWEDILLDPRWQLLMPACPDRYLPPDEPEERE